MLYKDVLVVEGGIAVHKCVPLTDAEEQEFADEEREAAEKAERDALEYAASPAGRTEAQAYFTAVMTDTLLEE